MGLPSISHPRQPLPGVDVLIGAGFGHNRVRDPKEEVQGENFVPGNAYLTDADLAAIDRASGGKYRVAIRTKGRSGHDLLQQKAQLAADEGERLFGFFGGPNGHLPFRTANGDYTPTLGRKKISEVRASDIEQFMRDVRAGKTAKDEKLGPRRRIIVKGGPGAAAKGVRDLSAVFTLRSGRNC